MSDRLIRFFAKPSHLAWAGVSAMLLCSTAAVAATDVRVWHALNPHNKEVFEDLVKEFNRSQKDVDVKLKSFSSPEEIEAAIEAAKSRDDRPHLAQLDDQRSQAGLTNRSHLQPMHALLAKHPIKDAKWFLADQNTYLRDTNGRLLAFPYMVDVPVMFYNLDAFKTAGITPPVPQRAWSGLQDQLVTLANNGSRNCPLTTDQSVSVNLENLAAVNNQLFTTSGNGLVKGTPAFQFDIIYIRHLSVMLSWVRSELMLKPENDIKAVERFANRECAVLFSSSGNIGQFKDARGLNFAISGLPYYPQVTKAPGSPFVSGSAIWAVAGHSKEHDAASAQFLEWLAEPKRAAQWYQSTGFLPLTEQAFAATSASYYKDLGDWRNLVAVYEKNPGQTGRGFRVNNYPKIKAMFRLTLDRALNGEQPAVTALKYASVEASKLMREKH
jgi:multiple sugar transport system substrate-binding protein